jgi:cellulose synthase/poly-beta-1,6-N-acetylglucosamine synthase-like glycosyltransferase
MSLPPAINPPDRVAVPMPRPVPGSVSRAGAYRFFLVIGALAGLLIFSLAALWRRDPAALFWITLGYFCYELSINILLVTAAWFGLRARRRRPVPPQLEGTRALTILIAAHNERSCIFETLESVFSQSGVEAHVIVASDGSSDGMNEELISRFALEQDAGGCWRSRDGRLCLLALPKVGKGRALNAGLDHAHDEVLATLDADTRLGPGALAALARAFDAPDLAAAGGFVYVRNAAGGPWLVRYQYWEYVKNFMWRIGLAHLGVCLQVSGAFGAFRARMLRELGGFNGASLVEDYEVIYRLHERLRLAGAAYLVDVVPDAVAYTESPDAVPAFVHQRTRWFAGFLQTLWDYRRMVASPKMGLLGGLMLPIKCVDAILPLWGFLSLLILLAATFGGTANWQKASLWLFAVRWGLDLCLGGIMWRWHRRLFPDRGHELSGRTLAFCMASEGFIFNWFRQIAVLNAYSWFARRVQKWHQPRWTAPRP